jgi:hypothetical protein
MKIIQVYNQSNPDFFDVSKGLRRPLIDHYYQAYPKDDLFSQICIVDTNHDAKIFRDRYGLFSRTNMECKNVDIETYNVLSELRPSLTINSDGLFLRSHLINVLLDLGYDTINIVDFSCRVFNMDNVTDLYTRLPNKWFRCDYVEITDEESRLGEVIVSREV